MEITEICLRNFMCFEYLTRELTRPFLFIIGDPREKRALIDAIKFIIGPEYCDEDEARNFLANSCKGEGYVRINFLISKEEEEEPKTLVAVRSFGTFDVIFYKLNETSNYVPVEEFQKEFHTNPTTAYPFFDCDLDTSEDSENLLNFWDFNISQTLKSYKENTANLDDKSVGAHGDLLKIALRHQRMLVDYEKIENFRIFINFITNLMGIFELLTFGEYSVLFYVEDDESLSDLTTSNLNDGKFKNIVTFIRSKDDSYLWTSREPYLRHLLKIATRICFAVFFDNYIIVFNENNALKEFQTMELVCADYLKKELEREDEPARQKETHRTNYLKRIVDICSEYRLTIFFDYDDTAHGIEGANVLNCSENASSFTEVDGDFVMEDLSSILALSYIPDST